MRDAGSVRSCRVCRFGDCRGFANRRNRRSYAFRDWRDARAVSRSGIKSTCYEFPRNEIAWNVHFGTRIVPACRMKVLEAT